LGIFATFALVATPVEPPGEQVSGDAASESGDRPASTF
jgi:hypothetical protein